MDKNTWIGFGLIAAVIIGFSIFNKPSKEELAERQRVQDSINVVMLQEQKAKEISEAIAKQLLEEQKDTLTQEEQRIQLAALYGPFAPAAQGGEGVVTLENDLVRIGINRLGGYISKAELKNYKAYGDTINPLCLFQTKYEIDGLDTTVVNEQELNFILNTNNNLVLATKHLYFVPVVHNSDTLSSNLVMRLYTSVENSYIDFVYSLPADDYMVSLSIQPHNMHLVLAQNMSSLMMQWDQKIPQQEKGRKFEEKYAQLQYMFVGGDMEKLKELKADSKKESSRIKWIAHKDQFFSTVMIAKDAFESAELESTPMGAHTPYIVFTKNSYHFNGSKIDRSFSYSKIDKALNGYNQAEYQRQYEPYDMQLSQFENKELELISGSLGLLNFTSLPDADSQEEAEFHRQMQKKPKKKKTRGFKL